MITRRQLVVGASATAATALIAGYTSQITANGYPILNHPVDYERTGITFGSLTRSYACSLTSDHILDLSR